MDELKPMNIRIAVEDESSLYNQFSPEAEFSGALKEHIRSKTAVKDEHQSIYLTVMSQVPLDEERFRSAVSNWIRDEKVVFRKRIKDLIYKLAVHLITGSVLIILSLLLQERFEMLKYSLLPIMASFGLGNAVGIILEELPNSGRMKFLLKEMEQYSVITFEYGSGQNPEESTKPGTE